MKVVYTVDIDPKDYGNREVRDRLANRKDSVGSLVPPALRAAVSEALYKPFPEAGTKEPVIGRISVRVED